MVSDAPRGSRQNLITLLRFKRYELYYGRIYFKIREINCGTPYCRERKLVTSSSVRNPTSLAAERGGSLVSFWTSCLRQLLLVMTFSLTRDHPIVETYLDLLSCGREMRFSCDRRERPPLGGEIAAYRVDINCQRRRAVVPVTLVPVLPGCMAESPYCSRNPRQLRLKRLPRSRSGSVGHALR